MRDAGPVPRTGDVWTSQGSRCFYPRGAKR
jgi:hypothetical protein